MGRYVTRAGDGEDETGQVSDDGVVRINGKGTQLKTVGERRHTGVNNLPRVAATQARPGRGDRTHDLLTPYHCAITPSRRGENKTPRSAAAAAAAGGGVSGGSGVSVSQTPES